MGFPKRFPAGQILQPVPDHFWTQAPSPGRLIGLRLNGKRMGRSDRAHAVFHRVGYLLEDLTQADTPLAATQRTVRAQA